MSIIRRLALFALLLLSIGLMLMPESSPTPAFARLPNLPQSQVRLIDAAGTRSSGVYLGHGLILTAWQNVAGERYLWDVAAEKAPALRHQLPFYIHDDYADPAEYALGLWLCVWEGAYRVSAVAYNSTCIAYNLAEGMRVTHSISEQQVGVEQLLIADRAKGIALLKVNDVELADTFPELESAPLDVYHLAPRQMFYSGTLGSQGQPLTIRRPQLMTQPLHGDFDGSAQQTWVVAVQNQSGPRLGAYTRIGQPYFSQRGGVIGLVWAMDAETEQDFLTPTTHWYHQLWQINEQLQDDALATVLASALLPEAIRGKTSIGDPFALELGNSGYDIQHYDLNLQIDPTMPYLEGRATITVKATYHHLSVMSLDLRGMSVHAVKVGGQPTSFDVQARKLVIYLPTPVGFGTVFDVVIDYSGEPAQTSTPYSRVFNVGLTYMDDPPRLAFANQPDGASTWYPCNDHPLDRATYTFHLTVPPSYTGVANGIPVEVIENGDETLIFGWRMDRPMATNLAVVAVADYRVIEEVIESGITVRHYAYNGTEAKVAEVLSSTGLIFEYMETLFGSYPFEAYGYVVTPMPSGAIETQTMVMMPRSIVQSDGEEALFTLVAHELAHHWYGNLVTLQSWRDIWLNEGMATYAEWLALELRYGPERPLQQRFIQERGIGTNYRQTPLAYPLPHEMYGNDSYTKGAWVMHMLRIQLGDDVFFELMQTWATLYTEQAVTTNDFFRLAEQISNRDLTRFRRQWLETSGIPEYMLLWVTTEDGIQIKSCNQRDVAYEFVVPLQIVGETEDDHIDVNFRVSDDAILAIDLDFSPTELIIDPDQAVLATLTPHYTDGMPSCLLTLP